MQVTTDEAARLLGWPQFPDGWSLTAVTRLEKLAGFFMVKANEIHAYRLANYAGRWLTRQDIENITQPLIEKYGEVKTMVRTENKQGHKFVQRLGFMATHEADGLTYYCTERLSHARL